MCKNTNGWAHLSCHFDGETELPSDRLCLSLLRMGCGALDYRQQAQQMELRTGGMSASAQVVPDSAHIDTFEQVGVKCLFL